MNDSTQMIFPDDPNKTRVGGFDPNATQMSGGAIGSEANRTMMAGSQQAITVECLVENSYAMATENSRQHLVARITASGTGMGARMPVNLCLILDHSGSMEGPPLDYMKSACGYVVDLLEPNDVLSVVAFSDAAQVLMPARRVVNKALIKEHIMRLEVGNTTNLFDGLALGASQLASVPAQGYVNRALLFTDGEPTAGQQRLRLDSRPGRRAEEQGNHVHRSRLRAGIQRGTARVHRQTQRRQLLLHHSAGADPGDFQAGARDPDDDRRAQCSASGADVALGAGQANLRQAACVRPQVRRGDAFGHGTRRDPVRRNRARA